MMKSIFFRGKKMLVNTAALMAAVGIFSGSVVTAHAMEGDLTNFTVEHMPEALQEQQEQQEQVVVAAPKKVVQNNKIDFGGWNITSTLDGHYYAEGVPGIAMTDYEFNLRKVANMSFIEYFFISTWDITQDTAPLAVNTFRVVAESENALLGPVVQININKMVNKQTYSLEGNPVEVTTMVGIPEDFRESGARYAVVCVRAGGVFEILPDLDTYDITVTFKAKAGDAAYAIIRY